MQTLDLQSIVDASKIEISALKEDNTRWRGRAQQILAKYERIDPAEHELLKNQVVSLKEEKTQMDASIAAMRTDIETLKEGKLKGQKIISNLRTALSEKEALIGQLSEKSNAETGVLVSRKDEEIEALKTQKKDLIARSNANTNKQREASKRLRATIQTLEEKIVCLVFNSNQL